MELTAEIARELLTYNPDTGKLFWKERSPKYFKNFKISMKSWNTRWAGKEALTNITRRNSGQISRLGGRVLNKNYTAHRIVWLIYYGEWPKNHIDHINQDPTDNRIKNLRDVTQAENNKNRTLQTNSTTGYSGVRFYKRYRKYCAEISINYIKKHLGYYDTVEEAAAVRAVASINYNFHPNHGNEKRNIDEEIT
jgi:MoaA/NifB/PqqE/SkfB family radical SAM enzyme